MKILRKFNTQENVKKLSIFILLLAFSLTYYNNNIKAQEYQLNYELINTKDMAMVTNPEKKETSKQTMSIFQIYKQMTTQSNNQDGALVPVALPAKNNSVATLEAPKRIWYLPTEVGQITSYVSASHFALDITSYRGEGEPIYPIANGVISSIYRDSAGAKIVTVNHNIDGQNYTSQYVHLSSYAPSLYVGKPVTINDYLGFMGTTGNSTGVHLHIALVDCSYTDPNGTCPTLNSFFTYGRQRYYQGFQGLQSVMDVPLSWTSR